ncbi:hypothetical protein [Thalassobellus sediminis]|uniref:hypothetical protein n=1 Tax=Thalassobellus sediminis TaxID=3367753 RepID=UPI0037A06834
MKSILKTILFFLAISCSSTKDFSIDKIEGKYYWKSIYGVGESIEFKSDSTFVFNWQQGLNNGITNGNIEFDGKTINLYSELKQDSLSYELIIPEQKQTDFYKVKVLDSELNPIEFSSCTVKKNNEIIAGKSTDKNGICVIDNEKIDEILIQFVGFKDAVIPITDDSPKTLTVKLKYDFFYEYFEKEKVYRINRNKIKLQTFERNKVFKREKN